jgi:pimeloyl-ACP methyl ester carboxylesterase
VWLRSAESTRAERNVDIPTREVEREDVRLAVHDRGPRDLPAAVIAPGVGSSPRFIVSAFAGPLASSGYRLVSYDLRGHGESSPVAEVGAHRLADHAADLGAVATATGARIVGGVSLGSHAAVTWAAGRSDVDGVLACLPGWIGPVPAGEGPHAAMAAEVRRCGVEGVLARVSDDPELPAWLRRVLERDWRRCDAGSLGAALCSLDGSDGPTREVLASLRAPVGVCAWPDDPGHPWEVAVRWCEVLPDAVLVRTTMERVGEDPGELGRAALRALAGASSPPDPSR